MVENIRERVHYSHYKAQGHTLEVALNLNRLRADAKLNLTRYFLYLLLKYLNVLKFSSSCTKDHAFHLFIINYFSAHDPQNSERALIF